MPVAPAQATPRYTGRVLVGLRGHALPRAVVPRPGEPLSALLQRLRARADVRYAEREERFTPRLTPSDSALRTTEGAPGTPAGTVLQWPVERQGLFAAWDVARGENALVAVIDSGIDANHPDLQGKIADALTFGDVGDPRGDEDGHGTHVASLACAATDNGTGIAGTGFGCKLLVLKADLVDEHVAEAIRAAADHGAHALVMAFGDEGDNPSTAIADAVRYAVEHGVVLVAAAADEPVEEQGEPANLLQPTGTGADLTVNTGLSVTAATFDDRRASFAGHGSQVSLADYGSFSDSDSAGPPGLFAAYPGQPTPREQRTLLPPMPPCGCRTSLDGDNRYAYLAGTSMSAPQVAGIAALIRTLNPDLSAPDVVALLKQTARRAPDAGWNADLGWGIVAADAAVDAARRIDRRAPSATASAPRRTHQRTVTVRLRAADRAPAGLIPSGVRSVDLYRSLRGGPWRRIARTRKPSVQVKVVPGSSYRFFARATDRAGNVERTPRHADAVVRAE